MTAPLKKQPIPDRPLSPHLQIYRPQMTSVLSILHRMTGIFLMGGIGIFIAWAWAVNHGVDTYAHFLTYSRSFLGRAVSIGIMASFFYHMGNGIRHLAWDLGYGFDLKTTHRSGMAVLIFTLIATAMGFSVLLFG